MARHDRQNNGWQQTPLHSIPIQVRTRYNPRLDSEVFSDLETLVNDIAGERRTKRDGWNLNKNLISNYSASSECCLKNGLLQCHCMWSSNHFQDQHRKINIPKPFSRGTVPYGKKYLCSEENISKRKFPNSDFILDDDDLDLLDYYDLPDDISKRHHLRNPLKVKTVSIIDTLSELASGATDREDEGGFSSAVSESAVLNRYCHKSKGRHSRADSKSHCTPKSTYVPPFNINPNVVPFTSSARKHINHFSKPHMSNLSKDNLNCSSLKKTLKYLQKTAPSGTRHDGKRLAISKPFDDDALRLCFSDSEVRDGSEHWNPNKTEKLNFSPRARSHNSSVIAHSTPKQNPKPIPMFQSKSIYKLPDWIQDVFLAASKGYLDKMKLNLKGMDPALVRNLSDDNGNNLWHICAVYNHCDCLNWLCSFNQHHVEALKDDNKNGFSPVALSVRYGAIIAVQWLIQNTSSKSQLAIESNSRPLLHVAARYGQHELLEWLLDYMTSQDLDINVAGSNGYAALHFAAKYGHIKCVKILILRTGNLKLKNENGLKPLDLALKHCRSDCADFLIAMESCYNLASFNLQQQYEMQELQKESTEMKSNFKELLTLTKRLQHRQKELVQSFSRKNNSAECHVSLNDQKTERHGKCFDGYSQLLSTVMTDEDQQLLAIENKFKKSRKRNKSSDNKIKPLDILRLNYNQVSEKANPMNINASLTPETSDSSDGEDENAFDNPKTFPEFSTPDVVNSLFPQANVPFLNSSHKETRTHRSNGTKTELIKSADSAQIKKGSTLSPSYRDVNLQMFFKQNPNMRQSSETCSVLEVLEPSSSDNEEISIQKRIISKNYKIEQSNLAQSATDINGSCSGRPSSSDSKDSSSKNSQNGFLSKPNKIPRRNNHSVTDSYQTSIKCNKEVLSNENKQFPEPDLIKGMQKKKKESPFTTIEREKLLLKDSASNILPSETVNTLTDNETDKGFSSATEGSDAITPETGAAIKKKSFLFKFALRGKRQSKTPPAPLKNEISPEEFRETYSRVSMPDSSLPGHQPIDIVNKTDIINKTEADIQISDNSNAPLSGVNSTKLEGTLLYTPTPMNSTSNPCTLSLKRNGLLPARRDPPPAPPIGNPDDDNYQDPSDDDVSIHIPKSSVTSSTMGDSSLYRPSDLWPDPKVPFRPASSASRIDSPLYSKGGDRFPLLNKSSSASTEVLSALDSTAGRNSPTQSEVSKTESALSPPSDISKTESGRQLSPLGKIEESAKLAAIKVISEVTEEEITKQAEDRVEFKARKSKRVHSNKPWYEFSDEEDIIVPQRYQAVTGSVRNSGSEDEAATG